MDGRWGRSQYRDSVLRTTQLVRRGERRDLRGDCRKRPVPLVVTRKKKRELNTNTKRNKRLFLERFIVLCSNTRYVHPLPNSCVHIKLDFLSFFSFFLIF